MTDRPVRVATRASRLALWQAAQVCDRLQAAHPNLVVELVPMTTQGDRLGGASLAAAGGKGLFVEDLESAIADGRADLAVHSMKDMPARMNPGFVIGAVLERADARDALVSGRHARLSDLGPGEPLGTSSLRRRSQLKSLQPGLEIVPVRGNVDTRLRRLDEGRYAALVLAAAGLERLGLGERITERLPVAVCLPAVGQGVIGVECGDSDERARSLVAALEHAPTRTCLSAERAFAAALGGSCQSPIAGYAELSGDSIGLRGYVGLPDGSRALHGERTGHADAAERLGRELADELLAAGGDDILRLAEQV
ncbi:MAG TPA: hydroxymethylbilane synthase [Gammaproteobacteria bacterium]|nr:hydroxymethylbilane synthase [Gammaproteobacteria bacterium]